MIYSLFFFFNRFGFLFSPIAHNEELVAEEAHYECRDTADRLSREVVDLIQEFRLCNGFCFHTRRHNRTAEERLYEDDGHRQNHVHDARDDDIVGAVEGFLSIEDESEHLSDDRTYQETDKVRSGGISEYVVEHAELKTVESLVEYAVCGCEFQKCGQNERYDKLRSATDKTEQSKHDHLAQVFVGFDFVNESLQAFWQFDFLFGFCIGLRIVRFVLCLVVGRFRVLGVFFHGGFRFGCFDVFDGCNFFDGF